jgi:predicted dinucleotide-binding enzyme
VAAWRIVYGSRDPSRSALQKLVAQTGNQASATTQKEAAQQAADGYMESTVETSSAEMIQQWNPGARVVKTILAGSAVMPITADVTGHS